MSTTTNKPKTKDMKNNRELGITKGEWIPKSYVMDGKDASEYIEIESDGKIIARAESYFRSEEESKANAELIADAGTTTNLTGKLPSQLAEENKMLLEALKEIEDRLACLDKGVNDEGDLQISSAWKIADKAIAKAEGRGE